MRLHDRGPDYRSFVELPITQDQDGNTFSVVDPGILAQVHNVLTIFREMFVEMILLHANKSFQIMSVGIPLSYTLLYCYQ